ncbi:hypothetical protein U1Q18_049816 [Sarracenia purpurea var. burkii]
MILGRFSAATRRWSDSVCVALFCVCFFRQGLSKEGEACYVFVGMTDNSGLADTDRGWCIPGALQGLILSSSVGWVVPRAVLVSRCGIGWRFSLRKGGWIAISLFQPNGTASTPMCRLEFSGVYMADSKVVSSEPGQLQFLEDGGFFFLVE